MPKQAVLLTRAEFKRVVQIIADAKRDGAVSATVLFARPEYNDPPRGVYLRWQDPGPLLEAAATSGVFLDTIIEVSIYQTSLSELLSERTPARYPGTAVETYDTAPLFIGAYLHAFAEGERHG